MPHIHEKIDFTVEAFIVHEGRVLLRLHDKYNIWLPPGGHIELDEDPVEAVIREVREEVGLQIKLQGELPSLDNSSQKMLLPPRFMGRHHINEKHEHIVMYYFATVDHSHVTASGADASDTWKWFSPDELAAVEYGIREDISYFAAQALRELG